MRHNWTYRGGGIDYCNRYGCGMRRQCFIPPGKRAPQFHYWMPNGTKVASSNRIVPPCRAKDVSDEARRR